MANLYPVVFVHGLFGFGPDELFGYPYFGTAKHVPGSDRTIFTSVGPISSNWDRAAEVFYQLKGGAIDYTVAHSAANSHGRYGQNGAPLPGLYPQWDENHPIHLVGHSMGAPTIRKLQQMLDQQAFQGHATNAHWACSISTISGVNNGSTLTNMLGTDEKTGKIKSGQEMQFISMLLELLLAAYPAALNGIYDFQLSQWGLSRGPNETLKDYVVRIAQHTDFLKGVDNAAYDLSVPGVTSFNAVSQDDPRTYYFSYNTCATYQTPLFDSAMPDITMNPILAVPAFWMGHYRPSPPLYAGFQASDWFANDGAVSLYSQDYPKLPQPRKFTVCSDATSGFTPGTWNVMPTLMGWDHLDIATTPDAMQVIPQVEFYTRLFKRLADL
jgi:triacylglycerol lipase